MMPATRADALAALEEFVPRMARYAGSRNVVEGGHAAVSRLSGAIRHRLLLEEEVVARSLAAHPFARIEKWIQEILWRTYWKGWLECRPGVWDSYEKRTAQWSAGSPILRRADEVAAGRSGVAVMDRFARELLETGYVHNHARMWWASFWIHVERLPWELGAAHYLSHLNDADPASNTLSWRWVAGLQTRGKSYLVRRSNLEKYCIPLEPEGLDRLEDPEAIVPDDEPVPGPRPLPEVSNALPGEPCLLWLHEDDLCPEIGPLAGARPTLVAALEPVGGNRFRHAAIADGLARAAAHFGCPAQCFGTAGELAAAADGAGVVAFAPFVGPARAQAEALCGGGVRCSFFRRAWDERFFPHAARGFFPFWNAVSKELSRGGVAAGAGRATFPE